MENQEIVEIVDEIVGKFMELANINNGVGYSVEFVNFQGMENTLKVAFEGEDLGFLIGSQGTHLRSLQYIISLILNIKYEINDSNILVDAGGYVEDMVTRLERVALEKADDARIEGRAVSLSPMSAFERKIVHTMIGHFDDVYTKSEGEGDDRHVQIIPKSDEEIGIETDSTGDEAEQESEE